MTYEKMRGLVLESKSDTLFAQRFREAFGVCGRKDRGVFEITEHDFRKRNERKALMECMAQRVGALDRV